MLRRPIFGFYPEQRLTRAVAALAQLLAGLFLVVMYNVWSPPAAVIITIIGWLTVIEAGAYLLLPDDAVSRFIGTFNTEGWYFAGGLLAIAAGIYLAAFGFGWI